MRGGGGRGVVENVVVFSAEGGGAAVPKEEDVPVGAVGVAGGGGKGEVSGVVPWVWRVLGCVDEAGEGEGKGGERGGEAEVPVCGGGEDEGGGEIVVDDSGSGRVQYKTLSFRSKEGRKLMETNLAHAFKCDGFSSSDMCSDLFISLLVSCHSSLPLTTVYSIPLTLAAAPNPLKPFFLASIESPVATTMISSNPNLGPPISPPLTLDLRNCVNPKTTITITHSARASRPHLCNNRLYIVNPPLVGRHRASAPRPTPPDGRPFSSFFE